MMDTRVSLSVEGLKVKLCNEHIAIEFNENAAVDSLIKDNKELVGNLNGSERDPDRFHTFYVDYYAQGKFRNIKPTEVKVVKNTADEAHIAYIDTQGMLYVEYHIILKKGESGLYSYVIAKNNTDEIFTMNEFRTVYRLDSGIFTHAYMAERKGRQPVHQYLSQFEKIQDETYWLPDGENYTNGKIYSKYDYAGYFSENDFWGQYGHNVGFWFIPVSTEYYPGGPLKQELLVHYDGIILNYMTGAHFGTGNFEVPVNWKKLYGPWYVYINSGSEDEVIKDAKSKSREEKNKWPYVWMEEELYPVGRGTVSGKLQLMHECSAANFMVVLAQPGGDFIRQKGEYIFYGQANRRGEFVIPHVRSGKYTLYAYADGGDITAELHQDGIVIDTDSVDLGTLLFDPPFHRNKLWQLGVADRSAAEFKFGNELRNYKWHTLVPETLDYVIGKSKEAVDWYYAQTKNGDWRIHFHMEKTVVPVYYLTVAIAGASTGKIGASETPGLTIRINGKVVKHTEFINDSSVYRSATRSGWYHLLQIELCAEDFLVGENILTFTVSDSAVMYDTILLEHD